MTRAIVVIGFLLAFGAGLVLGLSWPQVRAYATPGPDRGGLRHPVAFPDDPDGHGRPPHPPPPGRRGWFAQQLELTPEQLRQMDAIWSDFARRGRIEHAEQRRQLRRQREEAIAALVREEDRPAYERVLREHDRQLAQMETQWRQRFRDAVERTKALLTPEQREKYDELLSRQGWHNGDGPSAGGGPAGPPGPPDRHGPPLRRHADPPG